jgi:hypothetical protein
VSGSSEATAERSIDARLAGVHLRVGLVSLARAELETMAGLGELDGPALADLAEARWRSGDLHGAGEAARAHLDGGGRTAIAYAIAAEADAATGRLRDARELVRRLQAVHDLDAEQLDGLLAGRARAPIWPAFAPPAGPAVEVETPSKPDGSLAGADIPEAEIEAGIARGDLMGVALRLALLLRDRPDAAGAALELADRCLERAGSTKHAQPGDQSEPAPIAAALLQLVRGDALHGLSRDEEASAAYQACRSVLSGPAPTEESR